MGWYGLEAFNLAIKRTKKALTEPFDFWKWIRLGIIAFFVGGGGMGTPNFNSPASWQAENRKMEAPSNQEIIDKITQFWDQYQTYILIGLAFIIFIIFLLIVSVPLPVFMKYHLLTFMQMWYPDVKISLVDGAGAKPSA